jgi:hypothetical protein
MLSVRLCLQVVVAGVFHLLEAALNPYLGIPAFYIPYWAGIRVIWFALSS